MQSPDREVEREGGEDQAETQPSTSRASADPEVLAGHPAAVVVEVTKPRQVFLSHCWSDFAEDDKRWVLLEIRNGLLKKDIVVFLDSHSLEAGTPLYGRLSDEVRKSTLFVAFVSEDYAAKMVFTEGAPNYVWHECEWAANWSFHCRNRRQPRSSGTRCSPRTVRWSGRR